MNQWVLRLLPVFFLVPLAVVVPSASQAQNEGYDCITEGEEDLLCLALPTGMNEVDDQMQANLQARAPKRTGTQGRKISMLTEADLTASTSLETDFDREAFLDPATVAEQRSRVKPLAELEAFRANQEVQDLYIFLNITDRTGGTGDTSVITSGQK